MKITFLFGEHVCTIPATAARLAPQADLAALRCLLYLAANPALRTAEDGVAKLAAGLSLTADEVRGALAFWQAGGVLTVEGVDLPAAPEKRVALRREDMPHLSGEALAEKLQANEGELSRMLSECQQILARQITNPNDVNRLVGLVDQLGYLPESVMLVCQYCKNIGKTTVAYIERVAYNLWNEGVDDLPKLEAYLRKKELSRTLEGRVRTLCGIGGRALTKKEQSCITEWTELAYPYELIVHAWEISVERTQRVSFAYMDKILQNWRTAGYRTLVEVEAAEAARRAQTQPGGSSFDTDTFFDLALQRSYENLKK